MAKRSGSSEYRIYADSQRPGRFIVEVNTVGKRIRQRAASRQEAKTKGEALVQTYKSGHINVPGARQTLEQFVNVWWEKAIVPRDLAPKTIADYRDTIERYILPVLGEYRLIAIDAPLVIDMFYTLAENHTEATAHRAMTKLHMVLDAARRWKYVRDNAVADARKDLPSKPWTEKRALSDAEMTRLLHTVRGHRMELLYLTALTLGLRPGEIFGLQWSVIDWAERTVTIRAQVQEVDSQVIFREKPKTKSGKRTLPLPPILLARLRDHWLQRGQSEFVFTSDEGGMLRPGSFARHFRGGRTGKTTKDGRDVVTIGMRQKAHLDSDVTLHMLRHTVATKLKELGVSEEIRSDILGHSSRTTITRQYSHRVLVPMREALERLEQELHTLAG